MKQIKRTTLSQQDIDDHWEFISREHCIDLMLPPDRRQDIADDMVQRFIETFID